MGCFDIFFPVLHRRRGFLQKIVQQGDDRLPAVPVIGNLLLEIIQPRARIIIVGGPLCGKEDLPQQRSGKPLAGEITSVELVGGLQAGLVGRTASNKVPVIANAEAAGKLLIDAVAVFAVGPHLHTLDVEALLRDEAFPDGSVQAVRHKKVRCDSDRALNHVRAIWGLWFYAFVRHNLFTRRRNLATPVGAEAAERLAAYCPNLPKQKRLRIQ